MQKKKVPEQVCRILVALYNPKGVEPKGLTYSSATFEGAARALIGHCPELVTLESFKPSENRPSESWFVHGFRDGVIGTGGRPGAKFLASYKTENSRISLPITKEDREKVLLDEADAIAELLSELNNQALIEKAKHFAESVTEFENIYLWQLQRLGVPFEVEAARPSKPQTAGSDRGAADSNFQDPLSIVFCGPPGTGKTRSGLILSDLLLNNSSVPKDLASLEQFPYPAHLATNDPLNFFRIQFHPSFSYEDFLEGLRPVSVLEGEKSEISYRVVPGPLKVLALLARAALEPGIFGIPVTLRRQNGEWQLENEIDLALFRFLERDGCFKLENNTSAKALFLTGSASFKKKIEASDQLEQAAQLKDGFHQLYWFSADCPEKSFVLFIDELNRGNPSRIFGESLSLIEQSKRLGSEEAANIVLPYSHERLMLPANLHLVCAMNLSDRSLANIDQAFRRRFKFIYLKPDFSLLEPATYSSLTKKKVRQNLRIAHELVIEHLTNVNDSLNDKKISQDNHIGHSYGFKILNRVHELAGEDDTDEQVVEICIGALDELWKEELHPLLREMLGDHGVPEFSKALSGRFGSSKYVLLTDASFRSYLANSAPKNLPFEKKIA